MSSRNERVKGGPVQGASFIEKTDRGVLVRVVVVPRSSKDSIEGVKGDELRVRLCAPPVDGEANRRLVELLSKKLGVAKSFFTIETGLRSRVKRVLVRADADRVEKRFSEFLSAG